MASLQQITESEINVLKNPLIPDYVKKIVSFEASRNETMSRADHVLDRHIDDVEKGDSTDNMLVEAAREFMQVSQFEQIVPVRNTEFIEIEYRDYLLMSHRLLFDRDGNLIISTQENLPALPEQRYTRELTLNTKNRTLIGALTAYGENIGGFDEGFVNSFAEKLNTAILGFNRRKYTLEERAMLRCLNDTMGNDLISMGERRQRTIDEIARRATAREGYLVILKDGRNPTIDTITVDDLEIKESYNGSGLSDEKIKYILTKAVHVIKTPEEVDVFDDAAHKFGYALATELKINETGRIGGAFILFDDREFLLPRQRLAEAAGLKVDDYIILNKEIKDERELRVRIEEVITPMVGRELASYLIKEHDFRRFAMPQLRFAVMLLSDMKGSTDIADDLIIERIKLGKDSQEMYGKYQRYVDTINSYLGLVTEAVLSFEGVIDKYIGDAVMAEWGVPIEADNARQIARRAMLASVFANILTAKHNRKMEKEGIDQRWILQQRFVLHCGDVLAGIYGTKLRHNYTIMGAPVNETARIEGLPKAETGKITLSHDFYSLVRDVVNAEFVGEFMLKGKKEPVKIYHFKEFKVPDFTAFAGQYADLTRRFSLFEKNTFFEDFIHGKYNSETYLNQW